MENRQSGKRMAQKVLEPIEKKANRTAKDSVFVDLFERPEYLIQLYRILHPEDVETTEDDLTVVTLESLMLKGRYNDLGFLVSNRLVILVEAQSTWSVNIVVRFLLYIADTYNRYILRNDLNLYGSKGIDLPVPELYVVYTGARKNCPEVITLSGDVFGHDCDVEVRAKVIRDSHQGDILNQYIAFSRVFDKQVKLHELTRDAVEETLRICRDENILREYLRNEEVEDIMITLADKERELRLFLKSEREEARSEGHEEGFKEGHEEGHEEGFKEGREEGHEEGFKEGREEGHEEGFKEGHEEGRKEGREEGHEESMEVISYLLARNRIEDLERVSHDPEYMKQILEEIEAQKLASEE